MNWREQLVETIQMRRKLGARHNVIIVAEGGKDWNQIFGGSCSHNVAVDLNGTPIKCTTVKKVIEEATGADTRETILGHVQRGGAPSALDRYTVGDCILGRLVANVVEYHFGFASSRGRFGS